MVFMRHLNYFKIHNIEPRQRCTSLNKIRFVFFNETKTIITALNSLKLPECFRNHKSNLNHRHPDKSSAISPEMMNSATRPGVMSWSADQQCEWYWLMRGQHLPMCQWLHRDIVQQTTQNINDNDKRRNFMSLMHFHCWVS